MIVKILENVRVLICRPQPSADELKTALEAMGAECFCLPAIKRSANELGPKDKTTLLNLDQYSKVIAVSQMAASLGMDAIDEYWPQLPVEQSWHAIGRKTAQVLAEKLSEFDIQLNTPETDYTSEELIESFKDQVTDGDKVLLMKGRGGREHLQKTLETKGIEVDTIELYEREKPNYTNDQLSDAFEAFSPDFIITLSAETLENTLSFADTIKANLEQKHFIVSSERVAKIGQEKGIESCHVSKGLMPIDLIKAIAELKRKVL